MNVASALGTLKEKAEQVRVMARGTELEKRLQEALAGDKNWGASSSLMNQIAQDTYDYEKYNIIMKQLWTSMEGALTNWKKVFKALSLLEHLIKHGSERIIDDARDKMYKLRSLTDYNFYEGSVDRGNGVREKSRNLIELLRDNEVIREEREKARALREKFGGFSGPGGGGGYGGYSGNRYGGSSSYGNSGIGSSYGNSGIGSSSYGNSGIGSSSYGNSGIGSSSYGNGGSSNFGRYSDNGGGSSRYNDGGSSYSDSGPAQRGGSRYSDEPSTNTPSQQDTPSITPSRKYDIKIKKKDPVDSKPVVESMPPPQESAPDLLGGSDLLGSDTAPPQQQQQQMAPTQQSGDFAAFAAFPQNATQPQPDPSAFGNFTAAPQPVAPQPPQTDLFGGMQTMAPQPQTANTFGQSPMMQTTMPGMQTTMQQNPAMPPTPPQNNGLGLGFANTVLTAQAMNAGAAGVQAQAAIQTGSAQPQPDMFGSFTQAPTPMTTTPNPVTQPSTQPLNTATSASTATPQPKPSDSLSGGLVDLGNLSLNNANKSGSGSNASGSAGKSKFKQHDSFRGLDGFSSDSPALSMTPTTAKPMGVSKPMAPMGMGMGTQPMGMSQSSAMPGAMQPNMMMGGMQQSNMMGMQGNMMNRAMPQQGMMMGGMQQPSMMMGGMQQPGMMMGGMPQQQPMMQPGVGMMGNYGVPQQQQQFGNAQNGQQWRM